MKNKKNILTRFINFIKRIFGNEEPKQIVEKSEVIAKQEQKSNFFDELRVYKEEDSELLKLQNQYEKNEVDLCVMSNEQIHELNSLYERQISELKKKLNDEKTKLSMMQNKIKNYSSNM